MLRGGRGGEVRLKTYLSMLLIAGAAPHDVSYPARAWATLLDLPAPDTNGARRVHDAIAWLEREQFVAVANNAGRPNRVTLLHESGSGTAYDVPGEAYNRVRDREGTDAALAHRYIKLPIELWTSGWIAVLSAPALAMYLVVKCAQSGPDQSEVWFSPDQADKLYALSSDTRSRGLEELRAGGLVVVRRRALSGDVFDVRRFRNVYTLDEDRLKEPARVVRTRR